MNKRKCLLLAVLLASLGGAKADDNHPVVTATSPPYGSDISGDTPIDVAAPGMKTVVVKCWGQGEGFGSDTTVGALSLDAAGKGSIVFPANKYPHGPITVRISGSIDGKPDICYLQLFNKNGIAWNEGIPKELPAAAEEMNLVFSDDFEGPLSISSTDTHAKYYDHKPPNGSQDFSSIPFINFDSPNNPFKQVDGYLRIRADANKKSSGLISSINNSDKGVKVSPPCYFECRFLAPNAKGTWPAFWLLTDYMARNQGKDSQHEAVDELDIIEAYGGEGDGNPNSSDKYQVTPHAWNQGDNGNALATQAYKDVGSPISMKKVGIPSTWYESFHTYGCKITDTDTIYYCDNIEVGRHKTLENSKKSPFFFLVNLATGGGWPVDLSRYNGIADMYVDYIRVYAQDTKAKP